ncbi:hypothetical protein FISHEDRAFT_71232 [Fistulina hepatica ATCC 64428]|nr:hypothetical protein FISHEDRAFT_71232 [Fistulina hepatica ATCC 64428]
MAPSDAWTKYIKGRWEGAGGYPQFRPWLDDDRTKTRPSLEAAYADMYKQTAPEHVHSTRNEHSTSRPRLKLVTEKVPQAVQVTRRPSLNSLSYTSRSDSVEHRPRATSGELPLLDDVYDPITPDTDSLRPMCFSLPPPRPALPEKRVKEEVQAVAVKPAAKPFDLLGSIPSPTTPTGLRRLPTPPLAKPKPPPLQLPVHLLPTDNYERTLRVQSPAPPRLSEVPRSATTAFARCPPEMPITPPPARSATFPASLSISKSHISSPPAWNSSFMNVPPLQSLRTTSPAQVTTTDVRKGVNRRQPRLVVGPRSPVTPLSPRRGGTCLQQQQQPCDETETMPSHHDR